MRALGVRARLTVRSETSRSIARVRGKGLALSLRAVLNFRARGPEKEAPRRRPSSSGSGSRGRNFPRLERFRRRAVPLRFPSAAESAADEQLLELPLISAVRPPELGGGFSVECVETHESLGPVSK